jgi:DNA-binding transcriptional LysR family regulator
MRILYSRQLEHFLAIYEAGGLRQAASRYGVTQPTLTRSLQLLENGFSTTLFERHPNGVVPTEAAHILRRHAQHIINSARYAKMEIDAIYTGQSGELHIGCGMIWSSILMPTVLARLHKEFPLLGITMETGIVDQLIPRLLNGTLDFVIAKMPTEPLPKGFSSIELSTKRMVVLARWNHPLRRIKPIPLKELCSYDFLGFAMNTGHVEQLSRFFNAHKLPAPSFILKTTSLESLLVIAAESDNLIILPDVDRDKKLFHAVKPLPLDTPLWDIRFGVCYRTQIAEMAPLKLLLKALSEKYELRNKPNQTQNSSQPSA